jgi:acyl-CoA thioesterase FadM
MYGVVTNTKYHEYMYAARAALGASAGLSMGVLLGQYNIMLATTRYNITFKRYAGPLCITYQMHILTPAAR